MFKAIKIVCYIIIVLKQLFNHYICRLRAKIEACGCMCVCIHMFSSHWKKNRGLCQVRDKYIHFTECVWSVYLVFFETPRIPLNVLELTSV